MVKAFNKVQEIRCGGMPEHFNLPWQMALANNAFGKEGIALKWHNYPAGTGAMNQALRNGSLDMAVMLTEGAVADIALGGPGKIVSFFMDAPIYWGVHVLRESILTSADQLKGLPFAISTVQSGSHLMACIYAEQKRWQKSSQRFIETFGINGALISMRIGLPRILLWDKNITRPYIKRGELRVLDECPTPWRSLVVVVREDLLLHDPEPFKVIVQIIRSYSESLMRSANTVSILAESYGLDGDDMRHWLKTKPWNTNGELFEEDVLISLKYMQRLGILKHDIPESAISDIFFAHQFIEQLVVSNS